MTDYSFEFYNLEKRMQAATELEMAHAYLGVMAAQARNGTGSAEERIAIRAKVLAHWNAASEIFETLGVASGCMGGVH